jgi:hypothetical protein
VPGRLKYFSLYKYGFQILARNEFDGLTFTCKSDDVSCIQSMACFLAVWLCAKLHCGWLEGVCANVALTYMQLARASFGH